MRRRTIVSDVSLDVAQGETLGLIGPNGSGKSSLLRLLAGLKRPQSGAVEIEGQDIARIPRRALARQLAFVQQSASTDTNVSVRDVVRLGRTPHRSALSGWGATDETAVTSALARVERQVGILERDRVEQFGEVGERLVEVSASTRALREQTATLAGSLNASSVRGLWGETQLRRVLEHAGMLARCDFDEQVRGISRHEREVRPDVVVRLPGE